MTQQKYEVGSTSLLLAAFLEWANKGGEALTALPFLAYRGHADISWKLSPTLARKRHPSAILSQIEKEVIATFRSRYPNLESWTDIEVLAHARHHGAPTRLLDWSRNPLVALWFAVSSKAHDDQPGIVYQLLMMKQPPAVCIAPSFQLPHADSCGCGRPIHLFSCSTRIDRSDRQASLFTITTFKDEAASKSFDEIETGDAVRRFEIPAAAKAEIRRTLAKLGLDPFSIYGDPDSLGKSLSAFYGY